MVCTTYMQEKAGGGSSFVHENRICDEGRIVGFCSRWWGARLDTSPGQTQRFVRSYLSVKLRQVL